MPVLPRELQNQTITESQRRPRPKERERMAHCLSVLKRQVLVVEEHLYDICEPGSRKAINRAENPDRLGERERRHPNPTFNKGSSGS